MSRSLKETNFHGTPMFPLQIYSHKDKNGFYSVTAHWHEELEFLYIEEGTMHGIISGTPYEMMFRVVVIIDHCKKKLSETFSFFLTAIT